MQEPGGVNPYWILDSEGTPCLVPPWQNGSRSEQEMNFGNRQWIEGLRRVSGSVWMRHVTQDPPRNQSFVSSGQLKIVPIVEFQDTIPFSPAAKCPLAKRADSNPVRRWLILKIKIVSYLAARVWSVSKTLGVVDRSAHFAEVFVVLI